MAERTECQPANVGQRFAGKRCWPALGRHSTTHQVWPVTEGVHTWPVLSDTDPAT